MVNTMVMPVLTVMPMALVIIATVAPALGLVSPWMNLVVAMKRQELIATGMVSPMHGIIAHLYLMVRSKTMTMMVMAMCVTAMTIMMA